VKRLIACLSLVAAATTAAVSSTTPAKPHQPVAKAAKCKVAPADEYFGKLKMSILGIRNTIKDQGLKVDIDPEKAPSTLGAIALTEDAIHDWQHKYRCDSWLPGTLYALQHFYSKIHSADGVKHVHATFAWLRHDYPTSRFVQLARREDGQASATPLPPAATISAGTSPNLPGAAVAPATPPSLPGQAAATPIPGTAPQSVINAQNAMSSPSPAPHRQ
jgi:hypothetical protein